MPKVYFPTVAKTQFLSNEQKCKALAVCVDEKETNHDLFDLSLVNPGKCL